ncbi:MAG: D-glycero-beta-D-manno-heptose 1,7-bisphosphate 7-phosphatase [Planctomycetes bacterium]|nr:D-glycero-beta-D-manno-heptose 1,7-bisphosphate 7-phosphatase [Planctomycetota bacterium]
MKKAVFLDRDGTLIKELKRKTRPFITAPREVRILPGVITACQKLQRAGYQLVMITNQSGIARGLFTVGQLQRINHHLRKQLAQKGVRLQAIYYCPHHPEGIRRRYRRKCRCRKPQPGLLRQAKKDLGIDLKRSIMIGDSWRDVQAGQRAGTRTILVLTGQGRASVKKLSRRERKKLDLIAPNMTQAGRWINRHLKS